MRRSPLLGGGQPVLSLTTTGRQSGRVRSTVIAYMRVDDAYVVTAANLGSERDPAWFLNLMADPQAQIDVDGRHTMVIARRATGDEARRLWRRWISGFPPRRRSGALRAARSRSSFSSRQAEPGTRENLVS